MREHTFRSKLNSPIGELLLVSNGEALTSVELPPYDNGAYSDEEDKVLRKAKEQLRAYFAGELLDFDLPRAAAGTEFQQRVWKALCEIPYGVAVSYREIARRIGMPTASRAVGAANGRNPIPIIVPCHRVIGADGTLTGYGGGLDRKQWLLRHETDVLSRKKTAAAALFSS